MSLSYLKPAKAIGAVLFAAAMAACAGDNQISGPTAGGTALQDGVSTTPVGEILICKKGGPAGTYTFNTTVSGGGPWILKGGGTVSIPFDGVNMACLDVARPAFADQWTTDMISTITVTEVLGEGMEVDSIEVLNHRTGIREAVVVGSPTASRNVSYTDRIYFKFFNDVVDVPPPPPGRVEVCKVGGPAGNYTFHVDVIGGGTYSLPNGPQSTVSFNGTAPSCVTMYTPTGTWAPEDQAQLEISEINLANGIQTKSITVVTNGVAAPATSNTSSTTAAVHFTDLITVNFVNETTQRLGVQGCTPGYWKVKQHADSWVGTGYTQTQALGTVFSIPASYTVKSGPMAGATMLEALSFKGGSTVAEKAQILMRAAVAAVLNAGNTGVDYAMTSADIVSSVNEALASHDGVQILNLAGALDRFNNGSGGCPLN